MLIMQIHVMHMPACMLCLKLQGQFLHMAQYNVIRKSVYPLYPVPLYNATTAALLALTKSLRPADDEEGEKIACVCFG